MTTTTSNPVRRFDVPRIFAVFLNPRAAFSEMVSETRATWFTPMLVLSVTAILVVITTGYLKTRAAMMGEITLPPDWQWWTPDMQNNYMQAQQATQGPVFMYIMPLIGSLTGLWLGWLVLSGLLHLGSTLFGGRGSMQNALNIVGWGSLPFALRDLLRFAYMFLSQHTITSPSLSGFATSTFFTQILSRVDLFLIWNILLFVIGFSIVDGLPRGKSFANVIIVTILVFLVQAGLGALVSSIGGSTIQRPFF